MDSQFSSVFWGPYNDFKVWNSNLFLIYTTFISIPNRSISIEIETLSLQWDTSTSQFQNQTGHLYDKSTKIDEYKLDPGGLDDNENSLSHFLILLTQSYSPKQISSDIHNDGFQVIEHDFVHNISEIAWSKLNLYLSFKAALPNIVIYSHFFLVYFEIKKIENFHAGIFCHFGSEYNFREAFI